MINILNSVLLIAHILIAVALVGVVLLQRSEGGALGMGGGGAGGGLMSGRGVAGALVRTTMFLAAGFFVTSLGLTTIATRTSGEQSVVTETPEDEADVDDAATVPVEPDLDAEGASDVRIPFADEIETDTGDTVTGEPDLDAEADLDGEADLDAETPASDGDDGSPN